LNLISFYFLIFKVVVIFNLLICMFYVLDKYRMGACSSKIKATTLRNRNSDPGSTPEPTPQTVTNATATKTSQPSVKRSSRVSYYNKQKINHFFIN
jgi:hypothetical protein